MIIIIAPIYQALCLRHCVLIVLLKYKSISSSQWHTWVIMTPTFINTVNFRDPSSYYISQYSYVLCPLSNSHLNFIPLQSGLLPTTPLRLLSESSVTHLSQTNSKASFPLLPDLPPAFIWLTPLLGMISSADMHTLYSPCFPRSSLTIPAHLLGLLCCPSALPDFLSSPLLYLTL